MQISPFLLPHQNEECLRERSISLFRELLGKTAWRDKKAMRRNSWKALVHLVLHMSDQAPSVAKVAMSEQWLTPLRGPGHCGLGSFHRPWCHLTTFVPQASKEAVVAVAELFKWKELKELAQKEQIWQMGECLVRMVEGCEGCELCMWAQSLELHPAQEQECPPCPLHGPGMREGSEPRGCSEECSHLCPLCSWPRTAAGLNNFCWTAITTC